MNKQTKKVLEKERHWESQFYDDQTILYRIADLLEDLRDEIRKLREPKQ